jgi:hypothetical protein
MSLRQDIRGGLWFAVWFSIVALAIIAALGIQSLVGAKISGWSNLPVELPIIIASYVGAGLLGGVGFWATRPLRRWLVGWVLSGIFIGTLVYGSVGLIGVLGYVYLGLNIFDFKSHAEAWSMLPWISLGCGTLTGGPLGAYYWSRERSGGLAETSWRFVTGVIVIGAILALVMKAVGWW